MSDGWLRTAALGAVSLVFCVGAARAQSIDYSATSLGGNQWRYDYIIDNSSPGPSFDEVTVYFDSTKDTSLVLSASPAGWDPLVIQPDLGIPADGYLDVIDLGGPVAPGAAVSGFSTTFTYLVAGSPGSQRFELYDSSSFALLETGLTVAAGSVSPVPEPQTIVLMLGGLVFLGLRRLKGGREKKL
ncbi:MAG: PEP-CTERM sorting domain-containing protein [Pseudomonadota bacterium]|nr:PEP-CTERM sorting domain-containing protein [Pseudomonadota bacterium]